MDNPTKSKAPNPFQGLINGCVEGSAKLGGTPQEIAGRALACSLLRLAEEAFQPDPPEPGDAKAASPNPGAPAAK